MSDQIREFICRRFVPFAYEKLNEEERAVLYDRSFPRANQPLINLFSSENNGVLLYQMKKDNTIYLRLYVNTTNCKTLEAKQKMIREKHTLIDNAIKDASESDWQKIVFDNDVRPGRKGNVCRWDLRNDIEGDVTWENIASSKEKIETVCQRAIQFYRFLHQAKAI